MSRVAVIHHVSFSSHPHVEQHPHVRAPYEPTPLLVRRSPRKLQDWTDSFCELFLEEIAAARGSKISPELVHKLRDLNQDFLLG